MLMLNKSTSSSSSRSKVCEANNVVEATIVAVRFGNKYLLEV